MKTFRKDLTGQRFNKLLVLKFVKSEKYILNKKNYFWLCKCDCGNEKIIPTYNLVGNGVKSCGCGKKEGYRINSERLRKLHQKELGIAAFNALYLNYKKSANLRKLCFDLNKEEFKILTQQNCFYCNQTPSQIFPKQNPNNYNGRFIYNGIDRLDNSIGYTKDNIVTCCKICNLAKRDLSLKDFKEWIDRLIKHQTNATIS